MKWTVCLLVLAASVAQAQVIMNPGEAYGLLVFLSETDVRTETPKFKSLNALSIPVFSELPTDLTVVAGAITLKQQNLLSHVQLKSRARHTPNLDVSDLKQGMQDPLLKDLQDGMWVHFVLSRSPVKIEITVSTQEEALAFQEKSKTPPAQISAPDLTAKNIFRTEDLRSSDILKVGAKAANYGELANLLNSASRTVVRPGFAIPFYYHQQFLDLNPEIKTATEALMKDPLMFKVAKTSYRDAKLKALRDLMTSPTAKVDDEFIKSLLLQFDGVRSKKNLPRKMKLRSSTNSEDLPNFNGAGLYTSLGYNPIASGQEKATEQKVETLKNALRGVWASVWNLRAFDERNYFQIPHASVRMAMQVNPSFETEGVDGVVVTRNVTESKQVAVYIEAQRGDKYSVTNPDAGVRPEKILVHFSEAEPLDMSQYQVHVLQKSNVADDMVTILPQDNPNPAMTETEAKDLAYQSLKAHEHFKNIYGKDKTDFALDIEFKVDDSDSGVRQVYLKQARPYLD